MFELLMQLIPEWIVTHRVPMSGPRRQYWEKMRKRGILFYLVLWAFGIGGLLSMLEIACDLRVEHVRVDRAFGGLYAIASVLFALIAGAVSWHVNEKRYTHSQAL